jgi:hypothetical protein
MNDLFPDTLASALHKQHDIALDGTLNLTAEQLLWKPTPASVSGGYGPHTPQGRDCSDFPPTVGRPRSIFIPQKVALRFRFLSHP